MPNFPNPFSGNVRPQDDERGAHAGPAHRHRRSPYGRNWWCVLYPGLCRTACGGYAAPAENDLVCGRYLLRFKCVEWWQKHTARREDVILLG